VVCKQLLFQLRSSRTVVGRTRNGKEVAVLRLKVRGIAGYSTACVEGLRKAVESLGMIEVRTSGLRDRHPAATCSLLMVGGDERNVMVPVASI
jgi:hypothetical protein